MKKSKRHLVVTAAIALACSPAMKADSFTLLIYESKTDLAARKDPQKAPAYWAAYGGYPKQLTEAGILRGGTALPGNAETKTLTLTRGHDVPYAESKELLGGLFVIEVPDLDTALEWAARAPASGYGSTEVRPLIPAMSPAQA